MKRVLSTFAAFALLSGAALADPVTATKDAGRDIGHHIAQAGRATGHEAANLGREGGHAVAATGRDIGRGVRHAVRPRHHHHHHVVRHHDA